MTHTSFSESSFFRRVRGEAGRMTWLGVALLVLGICALVFPVFASFVATFFVGWVLVIAGVASVFGAFSIRGTGPFFGALLFGLLSLAGGVFLLFRPGVGMLLLTLTVGVLFIVQGAAETFLAFEARPSKGWGWMLASAAASVILAILIIAGWPGSSLVTLGLLMGVNFITSGLAHLAVAHSVRTALQGPEHVSGRLT
jgi:uncharacterized membrane protein HdeD (DUF308 family)